jgi:hypothetical protein
MPKRSRRSPRARARLAATAATLLDVPLSVPFSLDGFSEAEAAFFDAVVAHPRGWMSAGFQFLRGPRSGAFCVVHKTGADAMARLYPQTHLQGLSVTDRGTQPIQVHLNARNWDAIPPASEFLELAAYREALINHELGHVLGYNHALCPKLAGPADIMQQPSKPLHGCTPSRWVDGGSTAPIVRDSLAWRAANPRRHDADDGTNDLQGGGAAHKRTRRPSRPRSRSRRPPACSC